MKLSEYMEAVGRSVTYHPKLAKPLGSVNAAIFFGQLFYWWQKGRTHELGIYKTADEWEEETGLSVDEQRTARKKLKACGVLIETHKRLEHRIYYALDLDKFNALFAELESPSPEMGYSHSGSRNIPSDETENSHSFITRDYQEITTGDYKQKNKQKKSDQKFSLIAELKKLGVSEQLASDWQKVRKAKRLVETQTAFNGFVKQVGQSGLSVSEAVELCINRGWGGFEAKWLVNANAPFGNRPPAKSANTNADGISQQHYSDLDLSQLEEVTDVPF